MVIQTRITCNFAESKIIKEKNMRLKKFLSPCAIGIVAVLFTCSCKDEEVELESLEPAETLDGFIFGLGIQSNQMLEEMNKLEMFLQKLMKNN